MELKIFTDTQFIAFISGLEPETLEKEQDKLDCIDNFMQLDHLWFYKAQALPTRSFMAKPELLFVEYAKAVKNYEVNLVKLVDSCFPKQWAIIKGWPQGDGKFSFEKFIEYHSGDQESLAARLLAIDKARPADYIGYLVGVTPVDLVF